jgi:hypothetical protein
MDVRYRTVSTAFDSRHKSEGPAFLCGRYPTPVQVLEAAVNYESEEAEIARLRQERAQALENEIYLGPSPEERASYDAKSDRIRELHRRLFARHGNHQSSSLA